MAQIIDGRTLAQNIRTKLKQRIQSLPSMPGLAVILVGADPASHTYVEIKQKACEEIGVHFEKYLYFATETEQTIIDKIHELNTRKDIHGILVQLPLPSQNADRVIQAIDPKKDVDGFHPENISRLEHGLSGMVPAVALGIMKLIDATKKDLGGLKATIVSSVLFAQPITILLKERRVVARICQQETQDLHDLTREADILIVAEGSPSLITDDMVKPGAIVIDVGTTKTQQGLRGDVDSKMVEPVAGFITPVPGGVGPMTVAMLMLNVLKAYELQRHESLQGTGWHPSETD